MWIYTSTPPYAFMALCLISYHRNNFTFYLTHYQWLDGRCKCALSVKTILFLVRMPILNSVHTCYCLYNNSFVHSFIIGSTALCWALAYSSFVIFFTQTVGLLGRAISPSQGRYLHTGQHKHRINAHTDIHALSGIRTHDPSVRESKHISSLRLLGHRDRRLYNNTRLIF
jgi:hypothetical protein